MKYRLVHITENGPYDYTLRIEERISVWSRFFLSVKPKVYVIHGSDGFWEHRVTGISVPQDVCDFANEVMKQYDYSLRLRK